MSERRVVDATDMAVLIRDYLTEETDCTSPSFHATALASRIAPNVTFRSETAR